ncbi:hypothetical protein [uncultured Methanobrevibacter sp.]|uniref:hypothetical protein n=1 Tax=uncultured Methanobrevibacter sp. TaxID=253161 RepID=UPI0025CBFC6C|nr:hypothetical protein [uncultured Methanobrevibacter sp.]
MDKRYLFIFIIVFLCCINLYLIVINSDEVGSASVAVGDYICTIPQGFSLYESKKNSVNLFDEDSKIVISVYSHLSKNDTYNRKMVELNNNSNVAVLSNGTINVEDMNIYSIFYRRVDNNQNRSTFYFTKDNNTFRILITDFNYKNDYNKILEYANIISTSMRRDYRMY